MASRTVLPLILLALCGCARNRGTSDFMTSINSISPGTAMEAVQDELGQPDEKRQGVTPVMPPPGPMEALSGRVPAGTRYRQWIYKRSDSHYHVFFARTTVQSGDDWEVVLVRATPASETY